MITNKLYENLEKSADINIIKNNVSRLLSKNIDEKVGLVYGKVQSGKTNSIIGLSGELIDRDYRLIIIFISDIEELLTQNFDNRIQPIYKGIYKNYPQDVILFNTIKDDFKELNQETINRYYSNDNSLIICALKNHIHFERIINKFKNTNFINTKAIIIDDEGDDISHNTKKNKNLPGEEIERSTVNRKLIELKETLNCGLISITATPQSNLFLETFQSLSPDYCSYFDQSQNYTGLEIFHTNENIVEIIDEDTSNIYKKDGGIPESVRKALNYFIVSSSFLKFKNYKQFKTQMLIHPDSKIKSHEIVKDNINLIIEYEYKNLQTIKSDTSKNIISQFKKIYRDLIENETENEHMDFENFFNEYILDTISNIYVHILNSKNKKLHNKVSLERIIEISPNNLILIGGNMLDRGVTIPKLIVSFMLRDSSMPQADTLIQRARWLGYRDNLKYTKVYLTKNLAEKYEKLVEHEEDLSRRIKYFSDNFIDMKKLEELILNLDDSIQLTGKNKAAGYKPKRTDEWTVQKYFTRNYLFNNSNLNLINRFKEEIEESFYKEEYGNYFYEVDINKIYEFIEKFKISDKDSDFKFKLDNLIEKIQVNKIEKFDVVLMRGGKDEERSLDENGSGINNIMQGRGSLTNKDSYPGDRSIINSKMMLQIHNVKLKQDFFLENNLFYEKGTVLPMIAIGIPLNELSKFIESDKNKIARKKI
jgi:hypothetical protein